MITRRYLMFCACGFVAPSFSWAQSRSFPQGLVRVVVPFPPGGATDALARVMTLPLQAVWGQSVIQENRPGAAGLIGAKQVASSPPDGHTLLMASTGTILALASSAGAASPFDIAKELAPVSLVAAPPYIVVVHPSVQARTAGELIDLAKRNPGKLTYGSSGVGSASHLSGALFAQLSGIDLLHVPYRGTGPATTDLLGGRIDIMFSPALTATPHIAAGTLRVLGVTSAARSALFPDFPTIAENGLPNYSSVGWFGLFAPAATPAELVAKISTDLGDVLRSDDSKKRLAEQGAEPAPNSPSEFANYVNSDIAKWLELTRKADIKLSP
jgi:tripartite-type tricarboxylate transporter receptor subunit TctC